MGPESLQVRQQKNAPSKKRFTLFSLKHVFSKRFCCPEKNLRPEKSVFHKTCFLGVNKRPFIEAKET
jgi:hypothetical protein